MLKYGQEQDNFFEIIEKGNFFSPTKGEEPASVYTEHCPKYARLLKVLKSLAFAAGAICFLIMLIAFFK